jgi:SAM-dependent methyltransferase
MSVSEAVWHEVENGAYAQDLRLWEELASQEGSPVLDLGCGTGRVTLHLARRGHEVRGVDFDPTLLLVVEARAAAESLAVRTRLADARDLRGLDEAFPLVIAPMQLLQLLGGPKGRAAALRRVAAALAPGGLAALAIAEGAEDIAGEAPPEAPPDVREHDGWVHASRPLDIRCYGDVLEVRRLRQTVAPDGTLDEDVHVDWLDVIEAAAVEAEGRAVGLKPIGRRTVSESDLHVGSTVVLLRREG